MMSKTPSRRHFWRWLGTREESSKRRASHHGFTEWPFAPRGARGGGCSGIVPSNDLDQTQSRNAPTNRETFRSFRFYAKN
jgi:hypothetical protein